MTLTNDPLVGLLDDIAEIASRTEAPRDRQAAAALLTATVATEVELQDLMARLCFEPKHHTGRCPTCGRRWLLRQLVHQAQALRRGRGAHKRGGLGCLFALPLLPFSLVAHILRTATGSPLWPVAASGRVGFPPPDSPASSPPVEQPQVPGERAALAGQPVQAPASQGTNRKGDDRA